MEYNMNHHIPAQYYYCGYPPAESIVHHPYGTTSSDYMNLTVFDNSCMMPTPHVDYHQMHVISEASLSPCSPPTPTSPLSASYSPRSEYEYYPTPAPSVSSLSSGNSENICTHPGCTSKGKFKRKTDLTRHIKTQHEAENNRIDCQHKWCGRTGAHGFSRLDHLREHLREVHQEKIPYKRARRSSGSRSPIKKEARQQQQAAEQPQQLLSIQDQRPLPQSYRR